MVWRIFEKCDKSVNEVIQETPLATVGTPESSSEETSEACGQGC